MTKIRKKKFMKVIWLKWRLFGLKRIPQTVFD